MKQESHLRTRLADVPVKIAVIVHGCAETGGANHCAIARQVQARSPHLPSAVFWVVVLQKRLDAVRLQAAIHAARFSQCAPRQPLQSRGRRLSLAVSESCPKSSSPCCTSGFYQEGVAVPIQNFRQGEIEAGFSLRASFHGHAEACSSRLAAVHRDDEDAASPCVSRVDERPVAENLVLNGDGVQLAGTRRR